MEEGCKSWGMDIIAEHFPNCSLVIKQVLHVCVTDETREDPLLTPVIDDVLRCPHAVVQIDEVFMGDELTLDPSSCTGWFPDEYPSYFPSSLDVIAVEFYGDPDKFMALNGAVEAIHALLVPGGHFLITASESASSLDDNQLISQAMQTCPTVEGCPFRPDAVRRFKFSRKNDEPHNGVCYVYRRE